MSVVLVNLDTGEEQVLEAGPDGAYPNFRLPWLPKGTLLTAERRAQRRSPAQCSHGEYVRST